MSKFIEKLESCQKAVNELSAMFERFNSGETWPEIDSKSAGNWIPCKERTPDCLIECVDNSDEGSYSWRESEWVLLQLKNGKYKIANYTIESDGFGFWSTMYNQYYDNDVMAWMPLPAPYEA